MFYQFKIWDSFHTKIHLRFKSSQKLPCKKKKSVAIAELVSLKASINSIDYLNFSFLIKKAKLNKNLEIGQILLIFLMNNETESDKEI